MRTTWIVVANRAGARILERKGISSELKLVSEIAHPQGRLHDHEIDSDKQGRSGSSDKMGQSSYSKEVSATEHLLEKFAKGLANQLDTYVYQKKCDELVLVAEPHLLGRINQELGSAAKTAVKGTLNKDLCNVPDRDIASHLSELLKFQTAG